MCKGGSGGRSVASIAPRARPAYAPGRRARCPRGFKVDAVLGPRSAGRPARSVEDARRCRCAPRRGPRRGSRRSRSGPARRRRHRRLDRDQHLAQAPRGGSGHVGVDLVGRDLENRLVGTTPGRSRVGARGPQARVVCVQRGGAGGRSLASDRQDRQADLADAWAAHRRTQGAGAGVQRQGRSSDDPLAARGAPAGRRGPRRTRPRRAGEAASGREPGAVGQSL